jgi:hypothetical protein
MQVWGAFRQAKEIDEASKVAGLKGYRFINLGKFYLLKFKMMKLRDAPM